MNILDKIIENKKAELSVIKENMSLEEIFDTKLKKRDFRESIRKPVSLIAEIKIMSPSEGRICERSPVELVGEYESAGASAVSVVTDNRFFGGTLGLLKEISESTNLPVLRKDFVVDRYQIYESMHYGADALLLIASILEDGQLKEFVEVAESIGLDVVVEVHNEKELRRAIDSGTEIIGINNRDLGDFTVDIGTTNKLIGMIPEGIVVISESGIMSRRDVLSLNKRVNAILVGTSLINADDVKAKVKELIGNGKG